MSVKLNDFIYVAAVATGDVVKSLKVVAKDAMTEQAKKDFQRNKLRILDFNALVASTRIFKENFLVAINGATAKEVANFSNEDLGTRLQEALEDYVQAEIDNGNTGAETVSGSKKGGPPKKGNGAAKKDDAPAPMTDEEKAAAEKAKAEAKEKAEAERKAKAEAKEKAKAEAKEKREAEAAAKAEARKKAQEEGEAELEKVKAEHDEKVAEAEEAVKDAQESLKEAKAARTEALKEVADKFKISMPGGASNITQVPKSTGFILEEDYEGLDGKVIPKGSKLTVKMIHLAGIKAGTGDEDIVAEIKKHFPNGSTTKKDVAWHKNMVKTGKMDPDTGKRLD